LKTDVTSKIIHSLRTFAPVPDDCYSFKYTKNNRSGNGGKIWKNQPFTVTKTDAIIPKISEYEISVSWLPLCKQTKKTRKSPPEL
jgi:hypothetical protein